MKNTLRNGLVCGLVILASALSGAAEFDQTHSRWGQVLERRVKDGLVDYAGLKAEPAALNNYLDQLASVPEAVFKRWTRDQQIAFLTNLYNATTLKLILDHYPIASIKKIGGLFGSPWHQDVVRVFGEIKDLGEIEHGILRPQYHEPRIHFALVCAAMGCPPLRAEPYVGERLSEQLDDQARQFLNTPAKNRVQAGEKTVYLSPIFRWYADDFEQSAGSVLKFIAPYLPEAQRAELSRDKFKIRYTEYDWSLNKQAGN